MAPFGTIRTAVAAIVKRHLRGKCSVASAGAMATQIALVLSRIRSGYLVDGLSLQKDDLQTIIRRIRDDYPLEIAAIWETETEQAFFINTVLLNAKMKAGNFPLWVSVATPSQLVPEPCSFRALLSQITLEPGCVSAVTANKPTDMVPLAAWLLDYPVAYVVTDPSIPFLMNTALEVYDCWLDWRDECIPLLKFSVPQSCRGSLSFASPP
ncbi:hypothetical protein FRC19_000173 [Serendipita sp. 401]|nr:hypothetical protein FRC19_000173 [Serendipita sp. 401]KAG9058692.1 hypothetical protein FS842_006029 [Serendipita sp. 407]